MTNEPVICIPSRLIVVVLMVLFIISFLIHFPEKYYFALSRYIYLNESICVEFPIMQRHLKDNVLIHIAFNALCLHIMLLMCPYLSLDTPIYDIIHLFINDFGANCYHVFNLVNDLIFIDCLIPNAQRCFGGNDVNSYTTSSL